MKFKVKRSFGERSSWLCASCSKTEVLDYSDVELISGTMFRSLLPLSYKRKSNSVDLRYSLEGCISLEALRRRTLSTEQFESILNSLLVLLHTCEENKLMLQKVIFVPDKVYYSKSYSGLRFVYIPIKSYIAGSDNFHSCVAYICENMSFQSDFDKANARKLYAYAMKSTIASSIDYERFLKKALSLGVSSKDFLSEEASRPSNVVKKNEGIGWDWSSGQLANKGTVSSMRSTVELVRESTGERWLLTQGSTMVGRHPECDVVINEAPKMSRYHFELVVRGSKIFLKDLGSKNGTKVNGKAIAANTVVLLDVGVFCVGGETFRIKKIG